MDLPFPKEEESTCLMPVELRGDLGESLCLAYKTSAYFGGIYLSDDGYVLAGDIKGRSVHYPLTAEHIAALQAAERLPTPLPPYRLSLFEYALGYSYWVPLVASVIIWLIRRYVRT